jgi:porin
VIRDIRAEIMKAPITTATVGFAIALLLVAIPSRAQTTEGDVAALGPSSVPTQLGEIKTEREKAAPAWPSPPSLDQYGLSLAGDMYALYQQVSASPGDDSAAGGVARLFGAWTPVNRGSPDAGKVIFKVEYRGRLATDGSPQALLPSAGVAGVSGPTFSDKGGLLTNLYWSQAIANNRFAFIAGVIDVSDYLDVFGLINVWTEYNNLAFSTNPTIPVPDQGLGAAVRWMFNPNYYFVASLADANANPHKPGDFFSSFGDGEYFKHIEFGRSGSWGNRYSDNIHVTVWQVDKREQAGVDSDKGVALSWNQAFDKWLPFLRGGVADKGVALVKKTLSTGVGYALSERGDYVGVGANWSRAAGSDIDQYTVEAYYKWLVAKHLLIVPDVQYIIDPAHNPSKDSLWLVGVKARATF